MNDQRDSNYVSVGSWMWMILVTAIPIVGFVMMIIWAFTGENESRKNYFRAIIVWILLFIAMGIIIALIGSSSAILESLRSLVHKS